MRRLVRIQDVLRSWFQWQLVYKPKVPEQPTGEWYCRNENCPVRQVLIVAKYYDATAPKGPPKMRCPSCGGVLAFDGYRDVQTLIAPRASELKEAARRVMLVHKERCTEPNCGCQALAESLENAAEDVEAAEGGMNIV
ncbi:MAG: hypothetical protein ACE5JQ_00365 [Candidatus Methylomirabilales bacterium]